MSALTVFEVLIAIFLPPVAVFLVTGCGVDLLINILLCFLGFIPGCIHALYIISTKDNQSNSSSNSN
ncbi:uncharacterized protein NEMAJ01_0513 [Nematocida major]|uniref:uncharacterized protein n=1 Tax=Nematocida major TaxID=1912982 RepID=UPI0020084965|nr:uncharacterized protein NEMAJ01_0513 [Nematocida major]KAH9385617.1 hypothetical protein NEMAJ01_0513 [Nematocida major]